MSKNTGTSELINYFDLGANGDVGIAGSLDVNTIANATTDTDKFLVSDTGIIKYRTGAQLLSDIGAAPATGGSYLPLTGGTLTGALVGTTANFNSNVTIGGNDSVATRLYVRTEDTANTPSLTLFKNISSSSAEDIFRVQSWNGAFNTVASIRANGGATFSSSVTSAGLISSSTVRPSSNYAADLGTSSIRWADIFGFSLNVASSVTSQQTNISADGAGVVLQGYVDNILRIAVRGSGYNSGARGGLLASTGDFSISVTASQVIANGNSTGGFEGLRIINASTGAAQIALNNSAQSWLVNTRTDNHFSIFNATASTTPFLITTGGNVGIGTTSPTDYSSGGFTTLHINGRSGTGGGVLRLTSFDASCGVNIYAQSNAVVFNTTTASPFAWLTQDVTRMTITSSGNVGIGTASPGAVLEMLRASGTATYASMISGTIGLLVGVDAAGLPRIFTGGANDISVWTNSTERMRITSGGNVLIGTTSDSGYKLYVNGASYLDGYNYASSIQYTRAVSNTVNPAGGNGVLIFSGGQSAIRMDSNYAMNFDMFNVGNPHTSLKIRQQGVTVMINSPDNTYSLGLGYQNVIYGYLGGISNALYALSLNGGQVLLNSSSVWVAASDVKRKRNFESYELGLNAIIGLKPKLYNMDFQKDGEEKQVGLVAQEVREFIPLAYEENNGFIGLNYNAIIVTMVKAIQEQQQQIDKLKNA